LLLASCGGGSGQPAAQQSPPPEVTIATANNMLHTAEFVGVEKGFFLKHGVKVKLQVLNIGAEINKAMQSSSAQFGGGSITAIPTARQAGLNLTLFAPYMNSAITSTDDNALAVVARTDSGIKTGDWKSLVGKKIGLAVGGTGDEFVRAWMTKEGVGASQVTFLNVAPGNQLAVIQDKSVDAIASWEPYQSIIMTKLGSSVFLFQRGGGMLGYILGLETTDEYRQAHPDIVQKMADALVETEAWIRWATDSYTSNGFGLWAVDRADDGAFLGDCGPMLQPVDGELVPEIGYHIVRREWGRGYATEAALACRDVVLERLGFGRVVSIVADRERGQDAAGDLKPDANPDRVAERC